MYRRVRAWAIDECVFADMWMQVHVGVETSEYRDVQVTVC